MKCPFELPVKPIGESFAEGLYFKAEDNDSLTAFLCLTESDLDYIVQAINSYEKLRELIDEIEAVSCGEKQVADDDSEGMGWIYKRIQALKESEKP